MEQKQREAGNQLQYETSPYLLQHARQPVNWLPWGKLAFAKAQKEDKPIFLSIGYSTCHWCHVMARESFDDQEVADLLNRDFVAIKVDKEERPDVDAVYMAVCQALNGSGGWPLTVLLTPEQKPFYAATYLPKHSGPYGLGLVELLTAVALKWQQERESLTASSNSITMALQNLQKQKKTAKLSSHLIEQAISLFKQNFDAVNGGFSGAPKFPSPHQLLFLLRYAAVKRDNQALEMAEKTLEQMYRGGIFDHIGGGFCRYATDERWLVPHFEKMLYDNALLLMAYVEAYQITGKPLYQEIAERILSYIEREMTGPQGEFYAAQDADSLGEEGSYYLFTPHEIQQVLGQKMGEDFCRRYDITEKGNFAGKNIPNRLKASLLPEKEAIAEQEKEKLYHYRSKRMPLHKDDKILTAWNGLMIAACAKAGLALAQPHYIDMAKRAYQFIQQHLRGAGDALYISWRQGHAKGEGLLDDYAFLLWGTLELYAATYDEAYLQQAHGDMKRVLSDFYDVQGGGFFLTSMTGETLLYRPKELYDGAMPSGNSVMAWLLLQLGGLLEETDLILAGRLQLEFLAGAIEEYPPGYSQALTAFMWELYPHCRLVAALPDVTAQEELQKLLRHFYLPQWQIRLAATTGPYVMLAGQATFYLCQGQTCQAPLKGFAALEKRLTQEKGGDC